MPVKEMLDTDEESICSVWNVASTDDDTLTVTGNPKSSSCVGPAAGITYELVGLGERLGECKVAGVLVGVGVAAGDCCGWLVSLATAKLCVLMEMEG